MKAEEDNFNPHFKLWAYVTARAALFILYKICFRFKAFGAENCPSDGRGVILAPNHASYLDPPVLGISLKQPVVYLAKEYLFKPFLFGRLLRWVGCIPIKSKSEDFRSLRLLLKALKAGRTILIFPEGTRTATGDFQEVEPGLGFLALKSGSYVLPVYIEGTYEAFPKGAKWFRCSPVRAHFGRPFLPSGDAELNAQPDPPRAVSLRIMEEIKEIKEAVDRRSKDRLQVVQSRPERSTGRGR